MLIRLTGEQVAKYWHSVIKEGVLASLPAQPKDPEAAMNAILSSILQDMMQCWAITPKHSTEMLGTGTTRIVVDEFTGERSLLLYSIHAHTKIPNDVWIDNYVQMAQYAVSRKCVRVYCYTTNDYIVKQALKHGADSSQTLLSFPLL